MKDYVTPEGVHVIVDTEIEGGPWSAHCALPLPPWPSGREPEVPIVHDE